jgi:DNA-binding transcriptional MerR regulator
MEKKYYSIREVAEKIGEPQSTLRFWEKEIPLLNPGKSAGGTRRYVQKDIELLRQIKFLIDEQHLTLEGVKERLLNHSEEDERRIKVIQKLQNVRKELLAIRLELNGYEAFDTEFVIDEDDKENSEI